MSRGSYIGGHTVVGARSGWFTFSDAKVHQPATRDQLRVHYLDDIILATLQASPLPKAPKRAREALEKEVAQFGNAIAWAKAQPEYKQRLDKRERRLKKKAGSAKPEVLAMLRSVPKRKDSVAEPGEGSELHRQALLKERDKFLKALNAAQQIVRDCRAGIARMDRQLRQLK